MIKTIGKIKCELGDFSKDLILSTTDVDGKEKQYEITPSKFKNEAEQILWTMANDY